MVITSTPCSPQIYTSQGLQTLCTQAVGKRAGSCTKLKHTERSAEGKGPLPSLDWQIWESIQGRAEPGLGAITPLSLQPAYAPGKDATSTAPQAADVGTLMWPIYYLFNFDTTLSNLLREVQLDSHELKHTQGQDHILTAPKMTE